MGDVIELPAPAAPFWSDDFDMDLPKIFPEARKLLGELGDVELVTTGHRDERTGRLNHPTVWNGDHSMLAFFGFKSPSRDPFYATGNRQGDIRCTAWEMFRDCWAHNYLIIVERHPIWDTSGRWPDFETIMWDVRAWGPLRDVKKARRASLRSYCEGVRAFGRVVNCYPEARRSIINNDRRVEGE